MYTVYLKETREKKLLETRVCVRTTVGGKRWGKELKIEKYHAYK